MRNLWEIVSLIILLMFVVCWNFFRKILGCSDEEESIDWTGARTKCKSFFVFLALWIGYIAAKLGEMIFGYHQPRIRPPDEELIIK